MKQVQTRTYTLNRENETLRIPGDSPKQIQTVLYLLADKFKEIKERNLLDIPKVYDIPLPFKPEHHYQYYRRTTPIVKIDFIVIAEQDNGNRYIEIDIEDLGGSITREMFDVTGELFNSVMFKLYALAHSIKV